jgi:hypothetical protein
MDKIKHPLPSQLNFLSDMQDQIVIDARGNIPLIKRGIALDTHPF